MPKVSVIILTKDRLGLLKKALASVWMQSFTDFEVVVVDDGSTDGTWEYLGSLGRKNFKTIHHEKSLGISLSRQEALQVSDGEYVAILDDDDEWSDVNKLKKQVFFLDQNKNYVLAGGGVMMVKKGLGVKRFRPFSDESIKKTMLFRNNFFTSTVMFRRISALQAGGFESDGVDLAEDYDLWLRLGRNGRLYNFHEVFASYTAPDYNKEKFIRFLKKQKKLIIREKNNYPYFLPGWFILSFRILLGI